MWQVIPSLFNFIIFLFNGLLTKGHSLKKALSLLNIDLSSQISNIKQSYLLYFITLKKLKFTISTFFSLSKITDGGIETPTQTKRKPPLMKNNMTPRSIDHNKSRQIDEESIQSKPWSPTYSSPDLKTLLDMENEKLKTSGYLRNQPRLLFSPNKSLSMPSLNDVDDASSEKDFNDSSRKRPNSG